MNRKIWVLIGILLLTGIAVGCYWFYKAEDPQNSIPRSGIFVMEDPLCKHYM